MYAIDGSGAINYRGTETGDMDRHFSHAKPRE
jgi:hypothetical protein